VFIHEVLSHPAFWFGAAAFAAVRLLLWWLCRPRQPSFADRLCELLADHRCWNVGETGFIATHVSGVVVYAEPLHRLRVNGQYPLSGRAEHRVWQAFFAMFAAKMRAKAEGGVTEGRLPVGELFRRAMREGLN